MTNLMKVNEMIERVQFLLGEQFVVSKQDIMKENGNLRHGILIRKNKNQENLGAVYYLDEYLTDDAETAAKQIAEDYQTSKIKVTMQDLLPFDITDFDAVRPHLGLRLFDYDSNRKLLADTPFTPCMETLAAVPYLRIRKDDVGISFAKVTNALAETWRVDAETLYRIARENEARNSEVSFENIGAVLGIDCERETKSLYVLTSNRMLFGASVVLRDNILDDIFNELNSSFYLLPSSCHEWIIAQDTDDREADTLKSMVETVNQNVVLREDVLSNHVWYFDGTDLICY